MGTLHDQIQNLGRFYKLRAEEARKRAAALKAEWEATPSAYVQDREAIALKQHAAADDAEACERVAARAAEGYVLAEDAFMQAARFDEDGLGDTYVAALRAGLVIWGDNLGGGRA